jgi:3-oxoacyl-[acyl-carrier protein] reductase
MDLQLQGKRALVTGASGAIGSAIAVMLAREGVSVVVHGRREDAARATAQAAGAFAPASVVLGDLADEADARRVADEAEGAFGGIDILVNNAGMSGPGSWDDTSAGLWTDYFRANVASAVALSMILAQKMKERGWGRIIQTGSTAGALGLPLSPEYAASKAALANMSSSLAKHFAPFGVTSNVLGVGTIANLVDFEVGQSAASSDVSPAQQMYDFMATMPNGGYLNRNPMERMGTPEEVAYAVVMLASPLSSFINGALLKVDGGKVPNVGL